MTIRVKEIVGIVLLNILLRLLVSLGPYSGNNTPPMYGDYEAQRHWMEVTINLPPEEWYNQSDLNDLNYWGLDYPPLTAYHSYLLGKLSQIFEPGSVALTLSRGYETLTHKMFMRFTVLIFDILIYFSGAYLFVFHSIQINSNKKTLLFAFILTQPALILIDHGHFQYNSISLGLSLWAIIAVLKERPLLGSLLFTLSLNYKQMSLYYAPAFFFYLLGWSFGEPDLYRAAIRIGKLGLVVVSTFVGTWFPLVGVDRTLATTVLGRLFPFSRGLYEDKVANFWCSFAPVLRLKQRYSTGELAKICTSATLIGLAPVAIFGFSCGKKKERRGFLLALAVSSLSFFLFSYQVHEKSILLPLLPICLTFLDDPFPAFVMSLLAPFSMFPLIERDGHAISYALLMIGWTLSHLLLFKELRTRSVQVILIVMVCVHAVKIGVSAPERYPDLLTILFTTTSFVGFISLYATYVYQLALSSRVPIKIE